MKNSNIILNKCNIVVVGQGYVGLVTGACFAEKGYHVTCLDSNENKIQFLNNEGCPIYEPELEELIENNKKRGRLFFTTDYQTTYKKADFIFICVGTPEKQDGKADMQDVDLCALQIAEHVEQDCIIIIKSTVPIGTNQRIEKLIKENLKHSIKIDVVSNPEFLSQGSAVNDMLYASRIVIGTENIEVEQKMLYLYKPFECPIISVSRSSAELIKYAANNFLALKISYINDIANLCELIGTDIQEIVSGMCLDERIGSHFFNAGIGYGGSCLEKDAKALCYTATQLGYKLRTIESSLIVNQEQKLRLFNKASKIVDLRNLRVAVLGLTFKPNTDDIRKAPSLENFPLLLEQGNNIVAFDPDRKSVV